MRKSAVIAFIMILTVITCLYGCTKADPQSTENTTLILTSPSVESSPDTKPSTSIELTIKPSASTVQPSSEPQTVASDSTQPAEISPLPITINEMTDGKDDTFYLGQPYADAARILNVDLGNIIEQATDDFIEARGLGISYVNKIAVNISLVETSHLPTTLGLNFGDSYEKMTDLYGTKYTEKIIDTDYSAYDYKIGSHYFGVFLYKGEVCSWEISTSSTLNNY